MAQLKVLVVDDAAFIREMVRKSLRAKFPQMLVEDAINGRKAQELLEVNEYDLILCDWEMPEMTGIELLNWVRAEKKSRVPFVMVTSRSDKENLVQAIHAGVSDYIGKPFSSEALQAKVTKALNKHNLTIPPSSSSADLLSATKSSTAPPAPPEPVRKPAPPASTKPVKPIISKGVAQLRFGDQVNACTIKALSLKQLVLICKMSDGVPALLESVVVDLQQQTGNVDEVARINAAVKGLMADDSSQCEQVTVTVDIVDQDANKLSYLSRMIASGTAQKGYVPSAS